MSYADNVAPDKPAHPLSLIKIRVHTEITDRVPIADVCDVVTS